MGDIGNLIKQLQLGVHGGDIISMSLTELGETSVSSSCQHLHQTQLINVALLAAVGGNGYWTRMHSISCRFVPKSGEVASVFQEALYTWMSLKQDEDCKGA